MDVRALALALPPLPTRDLQRVHGQRRPPQRPARSLPLRSLHRPPRRRRPAL